MPQSIVIDATHFGTPEPTGVERYVDALLPPLSEQLQAQGASVIWVGHKAPETVPRGVMWLTSEYRKGWGQLVAKELMGNTFYDLFFTPSGIVPIGRSFKRAMTVHDLSFVRYPKAYSAVERVRLGMWGPRGAKASNVLIVPSRAVQQDLVQFWNVPLSKIAVVPHGPLPLDKHEEAVPGVGKQFLLFVGRVEEKKNLGTILVAFGALAQKYPNLQLVLAGKPGVGTETIQRTARELRDGAAERVIFPGYVTNAQRTWLYRRAAAAVVPCPGEGFGFPVLEAFEAEVPVVVADAGAVTEVGGEAVLRAAPFTAASWEEQLTCLLDDQELRKRLTAAGRARLEGFSWEKSAELTARALLAA